MAMGRDVPPAHRAWGSLGPQGQLWEEFLQLTEFLLISAYILLISHYISPTGNGLGGIAFACYVLYHTVIAAGVALHKIILSAMSDADPRCAQPTKESLN